MPFKICEGSMLGHLQKQGWPIQDKVLPRNFVEPFQLYEEMLDKVFQPVVGRLAVEQETPSIETSWLRSTNNDMQPCLKAARFASLVLSIFTQLGLHPNIAPHRVARQINKIA